MKKLFITLILCVLNSFIFAQSWDNITQDLMECNSVNFDSNPHKLYNFANAQIKYLPASVYERYKLGGDLMVGGWINFGVGLTFAAIGGILLSAKEGQTPQQIKAGYAFCGIGGTLVTISIPLLCFGDNALREANTDYEMFNLQYNNNN